MKNLLIYCRDDGQFSTENKTLAKIQIDNSLRRGWLPQDILLFTNFEYSYGGVKARLIPNLCYQPDRTNKIPAILHLIKNNLLPDDTIWYHDFDAFQDDEFDVRLENDIAFTGYGYKDQWNCGSFFFRPEAEEFFVYWDSRIFPRKRADEKTLTDITREPGFRFGYDTLDVGYNYGQRLHEFPQFDGVRRRVLHFHPQYKFYKNQYNNLEIFMHGKNRLGKPLMSPGLIEIFKKHGLS